MSNLYFWLVKAREQVRIGLKLRQARARYIFIESLSRARYIFIELELELEFAENLTNKSRHSNIRLHSACLQPYGQSPIPLAGGLITSCMFSE